MVLSDRDIKKAMVVQDLIVDPRPSDLQFQPSALDLRVGSKFWRYKEPTEGIEHIVDFDSLRASAETFRNLNEYLERVNLDPEGTLTVKRGDFVLMKTYERVKLPLDGQIAARIEGRSSLARLGISVHLTAPTIHCGFSGTIFLEVKNEGPFHIKIHPEKTPMCQIIFERISSIPTSGLDSIFIDQDDPTGMSPSS